jgi:hypothetical protein
MSSRSGPGASSFPCQLGARGTRVRVSRVNGGQCVWRLAVLKVGQDGWWKQDSALRVAGGRHEGCTPMLCTPSVSSILRVLS